MMQPARAKFDDKEGDRIVKVLRNGNIEVTTQLIPEMYALLMRITEGAGINVAEVINSALGVAGPYMIQAAPGMKAELAEDEADKS
jgi:hypothetical protein